MIKLDKVAASQRLKKLTMDQTTSSLHTPLVHLDNFLESFVFIQKFPASITCAETGKYLVLNQAISTRAGIPLKEYIGLTVHDIAKFMYYKPSIIENVVTTNHKIYTGTLAHTQYKQIMPIYNGSIYAEEVIKRPIYSKTKKIIAILGYGQEITPSLNLRYLFKLYRQYYPIKEAIRRFIQYMRLSNVFHELPTKRELEVLLTMKESSMAKDVARTLRLSPKTIDENKARLRDHLRNITLGELLMKLRTHHEVKEDVL